MKTALQNQTKARHTPIWGDRRPQVTNGLLADMARRIAAQFHPYAVVLFGSYAWGQPNKDSDVDVLVIMDSDDRPANRRVTVSPVARIPYLPMDLLIYTPEEIATRVAMRDFFILRILEKGRTLYERGRPWEQIEGHPTMTLLDEWIEKAEADYRAAVRLNRSRKDPLPDAVCFHCQQSAEKYLKAFLIKLDIAPEKTHSMSALLKECEKHDSTLSVLQPDLLLLDKFSVDPRYPGFSAGISESTDALAALRKVRKTARKAMGL